VLVALVLAGCSDDATDEADGDASVSVLETIRRATVDAGGTRVEGTVEHAAGSGAVTGRVAADGLTGEIEVGVPVGVPAASFTGWRWRDGTLWSELAPEAVTEEPERPWRQGTFDPESALWLAPYAPLVLLDVLLAHEAEPVAVVEPGDAADGTADRRRLEVQLPGSVILFTRYSQAELWVDGDDRLVRVRMEGRRSFADVEVVEWGVEVDAVDAPSPDEVGGPAGPPAMPDGDWGEVAAGDDAGVRWTLERAPGTRGTTCWRLVADPAVPTRSTGEEGEWCQRPATDDDLPEDRVQFVVDAVDPQIDVLFAVVPAGSQVTITDVSGTGQPVAVGDDGLVTWFADTDEHAVLVEVVLPGGDEVVCGPDIISELEDLEFVEPGRDLLTEPWFCQER
jgi:hypothetical protein